jgi:hypothetical protein
MADRWYYAHGTTRQGPFSDRELAGLAAGGQILPTDTIWKEGIERGVLARRVKNLFSLAPAVNPDLALLAVLAAPRSPELATATEPDEIPEEVYAPAAPAPDGFPEDIGLVPEASAPAPPPPPAPPPKRVRVGRAVGGKGALIVGQDGTYVKYRKKCTTCGFEESTRNTLKITNGVTRIGFYCRKCRKQRGVEIQGFLS